MQTPSYSTIWYGSFGSHELVATVMLTFVQNDHWTAKSYKVRIMDISSTSPNRPWLLCFQKERNWFIQQLQGISRMKRVRITFLSGDVQCAAVGVLRTLSRQNGGKNSKGLDIPPAADYRYMINVITSAIVNTPCVASTLIIPRKTF